MAFPLPRTLKRLGRPKKVKRSITILELLKKNRQIIEEATARDVPSYTRISLDSSETGYIMSCGGAVKTLQPYDDSDDLPEPATLVFERIKWRSAADVVVDDGVPSAYYLVGPASPTLPEVLYCSMDRKAASITEPLLTDECGKRLRQTSVIEFFERIEKLKKESPDKYKADVESYRCRMGTLAHGLGVDNTGWRFEKTPSLFEPELLQRARRHYWKTCGGRDVVIKYCFWSKLINWIDLETGLVYNHFAERKGLVQTRGRRPLSAKEIMNSYGRYMPYEIYLNLVMTHIHLYGGSKRYPGGGFKMFPMLLDWTKVVPNPSDPMSMYFVMVMERIPDGGDLLYTMMGEGEEDVVWYGKNVGEKKVMSLATAKNILADTLKLVYIAYSYYGLVHNDIRPENVMVSHVQLDRPEVYLLDLGLTYPLGVDGALACCNAGSLCTSPPESVFAFSILRPPRGYSVSSGLVYTLSSLIMYVLSREHVFIPALYTKKDNKNYNDNPQELLNVVRRMPYLQIQYTLNFREYIKSKNLYQRITAHTDTEINLAILEGEMAAATEAMGDIFRNLGCLPEHRKSLLDMVTDPWWNGDGLTDDAADLYRRVAFNTFLVVCEQTRRTNPIIS